MKDYIIIPANGHTFVDIAAYTEGTSEHPPGQWISLIVPPGGGFFETRPNLPVRSYKFHLRFSDIGGASDQIFCRLFVDAEHVLHLEEWGNASIVSSSRQTTPEKQIAIPRPTSLKMSTAESEPFFKTTGKLYSTKRTFYLKVENIDNERPVTNIRVAILSVNPHSDRQDRQGPWDLASGFSLAAGDHKFIPLVRYGEANSDGYSTPAYDRSDTFFEVLTDGLGPTCERGTAYTISIRATGFGTAPCDYTCQVWVEKPDGRLRISDF